MDGQDLPRDLFFDPAAAGGSVRALDEMFLESGSTFPLAEFTAALLRGLRASTDPDLALTGLRRFLGAALGGAALLNDLVRYPAYFDLLLGILGHSRYFADVLVREPALFRWLTASDALGAPVTEEGVRAEAARLGEMFPRPEKRLDALKRLHRREILRIGAQDILGSADLSSATGQLSALARAVVDAALRVAVEQVGVSSGERPAGPFAVIGLGKLGGDELNYSSDIDVIFVYGDPPEDDPDAGPRAHAYFNALAERLVRNLSQPSAEGHLYRVDTRLRPNAGAGPLALPAEQFLSHYEARGAIWERQMLIKARPVAGDASFGGAFIARLEPFVYPRTLLEHPAASVARIKARIEESVGDGQNIKLMRGGIRDIEFIAQTLQLVNGGAVPEVRARGTLEALERLAARGFLSQEEHGVLRRAYTLYRTVEHRLQMTLNTQTHTLPEEGRAFEVLARRTHFPGGGDLRRALRENLDAVGGVFDRVLGAGRRPGGMEELFGAPADERAAAEAARAAGFRDVQASARHLLLLARGGAPGGMPAPERGAREALAAVGPALIAGIMRTPDPDLTLGALALLASAQAVPRLFYGQAADPRFRKLVLDICAVSPRFARGLAAHPLVLEMIAADAEALAAAPLPAAPAPADAPQFKARQELSAGIRHVLGFSDFDGLTGDLSAIAEAIVRGSAAALVRKKGKAQVPLALFALGKFGTRELGFDADLDLLFVAGETGDAGRPRLESAAADLLRMIGASPAGEKLYDADVRLRPEGRSAPLVVDARSYARYLEARASLWERQSLTRLRFVAGDQSVAGYVTSLVEGWVYDAPLPGGWTQKIVEMRRAMESRSRARPGSFLDLKLGAGGMADVEFTAQMLQLRFGGALPGIRHGRACAVLRDGSLPAGLPGDREFLASAYMMFRRLELLMRIGLEERGWLLPEGERLAHLALLYDGSSAPALESRVRATMKKVRAEMLAVASALERP